MLSCSPPPHSVFTGAATAAVDVGASVAASAFIALARLSAMITAGQPGQRVDGRLADQTKKR
eukprot:5367760-Pyramimonas_sp.AAC.1